MLRRSTGLFTCCKIPNNKFATTPHNYNPRKIQEVLINANGNKKVKKMLQIMLNCLPVFLAICFVFKCYIYLGCNYL
jgi:hypothetical protein